MDFESLVKKMDFQQGRKKLLFSRYVTVQLSWFDVTEPLNESTYAVSFTRIYGPTGKYGLDSGLDSGLDTGLDSGLDSGLDLDWTLDFIKRS